MPLFLILVLLIFSLNVIYGRFDHERLNGRARIVNGIATTTNKWPWMVSLRIKINDNYDEHFCGGSIIRRTKPAAILTAGHCLEWLDAPPYNTTWGKHWDLWIDIGRDDVSLNETEYLIHDDTLYDSYKMTSYVYHENITYDSYYKNTVINDVGIIFISEELPDTQPIIKLNTEIDSLSDGDDLIVIGYGLDQWKGELTETLEQTDLKFMNDTACNIGIDRYFMENWPIENYTEFLSSIGIQYGNTDQYPYNIIQCQQCVLCTIGVDGDACNGDSGSPVIIATNIDDVIQVGIVSFGFECAIPNIPAQHTDIAYYYQWIQSMLGNNNTKQDENENENVSDRAYTHCINNALIIVSAFAYVVMLF